MNRIAIYPRTRSRIDPFLYDLSRACEASGWASVTWLSFFLPVRMPQILLLNWAENLWDMVGSSFAQKKIKWFKRKALLRAISRGKACGAIIVLVAHNIQPHGNGHDSRFWASSVTELTRQVDAFYHLNPTSEKLFKELLPQVPRHISAAFPVNKGSPSIAPPSSKDIKRLILIGVDRQRKNLKEVLLSLSGMANVSIIATGYKDREDFSRNNPPLAKKVAPAVTWLGKRVRQEVLDGLLTPGSALVLNQWDQLNSGLMWLALSREVPVIAPATESNRAILKEVGGFRLRLFDSSLDQHTLVKLLKIKDEDLNTQIDWEEHSFATFASNIHNLFPSLSGRFCATKHLDQRAIRAAFFKNSN